MQGFRGHENAKLQSVTNYTVSKPAASTPSATFNFGVEQTDKILRLFRPQSELQQAMLAVWEDGADWRHKVREWLFKAAQRLRH